MPTIVPRLFSRRTLLRGGGAALLLPRMDAMQESAAYGVGALVEGSGMVRIPAGEFLMGSDFGNADEAPSHRVRIGHDFEMSKFEITQAQWKTVMTNPHSKAGGVHPTEDGAEASNSPSHFKGDSLPVDSVSWDDIQVFLRRLNVRDGKHTYRLPTEAEWEYACKAGKGEVDPKHLNAVAWYHDNSEEKTQRVGQKEPNAWGLYDMYGNVSEWVQDWYAQDYYAASPRSDPAGPATGSYRVYRGACWFDGDKYCRATTRRFDFPVSRFYNVGFRVVRTAKEA